MSASRFKAVIAHGGGPTAVLNSSLAGVVEASRERFSALYAASFGLGGILAGKMPDLLRISPGRIAEVAQTPGSAIGSSRKKLTETEFGRIVEELRRQDIRAVFHTGGNGSMQTALDLLRHARQARYELRVVGIPKTIDNDLLVTHHAPGYASTAYFFACAARDAGLDCRSLPSPVCVLETLGRNAGWIVAATSLARRHPDDPPHLIYLPEYPRSLDQIAADVQAVHRRLGYVVLAVCEGQRDERGTPFGAEVDRPESAVHQLASNLGHTLARRITEQLGLRARAEKPGLVGRSCGPFARERDRHEAFACGFAGAVAAAAGHSGVMVALDRDGGTFLTPLRTVARQERLLPLEWISESGHDVTAGFTEYAAPLVGEVPGYARL
ncbi:MAG: diphosphate--fructose-6-phosphate 1-phosphotransferase [Acidobacteriota bacterium]